MHEHSADTRNDVVQARKRAHRLENAIQTFNYVVVGSNRERERERGKRGAVG